MKKKLTVGVFLALAVVLVASIVGVGVVDAAKPVRDVSVDLVLVPDENECYLTAPGSFEGYKAYGYIVRWFELGGLQAELITSHKQMFPLGSTSSGPLELGLADPQPCGVEYMVTVELIRKNSKPIRNAFDFDQATCGCPD